MTKLSRCWLNKVRSWMDSLNRIYNKIKRTAGPVAVYLVKGKYIARSVEGLEHQILTDDLVGVYDAGLSSFQLTYLEDDMHNAEEPKNG